MRGPHARQDALALGLVGATLAAYLTERRHALQRNPSSLGASPARSSNYIRGIGWSAVAVFGHTATGVLRKRIAQLGEADPKHRVSEADQVAAATVLQGIAALVYCCCALPAEVDLALSAVFWAAAITSGGLNAVIKTLETRAFALGEFSVCAPFLALDPVMQLVVGALLVPAACGLLGLESTEGQAFTARHCLAIAGVALGTFCLAWRGSGCRRGGGSGGEGGGAVESVQGRSLPRGAGYIMLNCVLYAFTSRLDQVAIRQAGSILVYFTCGRLLMAACCLLGGSLPGLRRSPDSGRGDGGRSSCSARLAPLLSAPVALHVLGVVAVEAVYMLSLYQAVSLISPVFITAVKRGGGVLASALLGHLVFGESLAGREGPLLAIAAAVVLLCA